jgi:hypothetical protein
MVEKGNLRGRGRERGRDEKCPKSCFHLKAFAASVNRKKREFLASQIFLLFNANSKYRRLKHIQDGETGENLSVCEFQDEI